MLPLFLRHEGFPASVTTTLGKQTRRVREPRLVQAAGPARSNQPGGHRAAPPGDCLRSQAQKRGGAVPTGPECPVARAVTAPDWGPLFLRCPQGLRSVPPASRGQRLC